MTNLREKIDIVYLWVDGSDREWQTKKQYYASSNDIETVATKDCRFINNDELKYSLRSLEKYANWINKIFIVTDNQVPKWLNTKNPRIQIVDHREIIPTEYLPIFNSVGIEHCIINIPNLSEKFLYANDDMFWNNYTNHTFFFKKDGYPIFRYTVPYNINSSDQYINILKNTDKLLMSKYKKFIGYCDDHNITAYRKSDVINCYHTFKNDIDTTIASKFRKSNNIIRSLYSNYSVLIKHGYINKVCNRIPFYKIYKYIPLLRKIIRNINQYYSYQTVYIGTNEKEFTSFLKWNTKLFCINDNEYTTNEDRIRVKHFLQTKFPQKSSFEL